MKRSMHKANLSAQKVLVGILMAFFLISMVSAFEFDNNYEYNEETKTATVRDCSFWLIGCLIDGEAIAETTLTWGDTQVGVGEDTHVGTFNYTPLRADSNIQNIDLINKKNGQSMTRGKQYKIKTIRQEDNFVTQCTGSNATSDLNCIQVEDGKRDVIEWMPIVNPNFNFVVGQTYEIGVFVDTEEGDHGDWIPQFSGVKIPQWAEWNASIETGLDAWWALNDTTDPTVIDFSGNYDGTNNGAARGIGGIINNSFNFTESENDYVAISNGILNGGNAITASFWVYEYSLDGQGWLSNLGLAVYDSNSGNVQIRIGNRRYWTNGAGVTPLSTKTWYHIVVTKETGSATKPSLFINGVNTSLTALTDSALVADTSIGRVFGTTYMNGLIDEVGLWNRSITEAEAQQLYNAGAGINPYESAVDNFPTITGFNVSANYTEVGTYNFLYNAYDNLNLSNVSVYVNGVLNQTNTTGLNNTNYSFDIPLGDGTYTIIGSATDNISQTTNTSAITIIIDTSPQITVLSPSDGENFTTNIIYFNATSSVPVDTWIVNYNGTNITLPDINTSLNVPEGVYNLKLYANNSVTGIWGLNESVNFTVHVTRPTLVINNPTGNFESLFNGQNITVDWNITEAGENLTEHITGCSITYNSVTTNYNQSICIGTNTTNITYVAMVNNLTMTVTDEFNLTTTNITSWTVSLIENDADFNATSYETSREEFVLNFSTSINVLSISAILDYNNTEYLSTSSCTNGDCLITNAFDIPLIDSDPQSNTFFWNVTIFNGTESISIATTNRTQNVSGIYLEACNSTYPVQTLNFTTYDEQDLSQVNPYNFNGAFDFWLGDGDVKKNNSFSNSSKEFHLCLDPNETMKIDADISYDETTGTNYTERFYYFQGYEISNSSQDIFMYLLKSTSSTSFILKVQDENLLPLNETIVEIWRYYPGEGEFKLVQTAKTNDAGKSIGFFEVETIDYKFIIKKDGEVLLETGQGKVIPETTPYTLTFNTGEDLGTPWSSQESLPNLDSNLVFDEDTGIVTYTYIDTSTTFEEARLLVNKVSFSNSSAYELKCNTTSTLTSATITCDTTNETGTYIASAFITRSGEALDLQISFTIDSLSNASGLLGLFFGWFLILIAASIFTVNEIAGIWTVTLTIFLTNTMGLIKFGGVFVTAIFAIAIIITWLFEK